MNAFKAAVETRIIPYIFYRDVPAALDWLTRAFGLTEEMRHPKESGMHAQMTFGGQRIMMGQGSQGLADAKPDRDPSRDDGCFHLLGGCRRTLRAGARGRRGNGSRASGRGIPAHLQGA